MPFFRNFTYWIDKRKWGPSNLPGGGGYRNLTTFVYALFQKLHLLD